MIRKIPYETRLKLAGALLLCVAAALVFANSIHNEFTNWDDGDLIVNNQAIRSLDIDNLKRMFDPRSGGTYQPVRVFSYALDYRLFELNPVGYHIHNIALHALAGVFLFLSLCLILPRLTGIKRFHAKDSLQDNFRFMASAFLVALLFVIHPVNVEAVTWLSSRKYVLLGFFAFLSLYLYVQGSQSERHAIVLNLLSLVALVLAVLSSPFGVVIPALFFLYEYARDTSLNPFVILRKNILQLSPYLVAGGLLLVLLMSKLVRSDGGASTLHYQGDVFYTLLTIFQVMFDYMRNFVCPHWLNNRYVDYVFLGFGDYYKVWAGLLIIMSVGFLTAWQVIKNNNRVVLFCAAWFFLNWLPASNIIPISIKMADRYVYLASAGVFLFFSEQVVMTLYGAVRYHVPADKKKYAMAMISLALVILVGFYTILTIQRNKVWENSGTLWSDSLKKDLRSLLAHNNLGTWLFSQGEIKRAERHFRAALVLAPHDKLPLHNLGMLLMEQGRLAEAATNYQVLVTYHPDDLEGYRLLADIYIRMDKLEQASVYFNRILDMDPEDALAVSWQGHILHRLKKFDQALAVIEKGLDQFPDNPELCLIHAQTLLDMDRIDAAEKAFEKAIDLAPMNVQAYEGMGRVCFAREKMAQAIRFYEKGLEIHAGNASIHNNLGNAYQAMESWDEALKSYRKALDINPDFVDAQYNFCLVTAKKGFEQDALACYLQLIDTKDHPEAMNNAADILVRQKQWDRAVDLLKSALDIQPGYIDAARNLGAVYLAQKKYDSALPYFEQVLSVDKNDPAALNSIGIIAHEKGDMEKAAAFFQRTAVLLPDDAGVHFNLGIVLLKKGEAEAAFNSFKRVLQLNPANQVARKIVNDLEPVLTQSP